VSKHNYPKTRKPFSRSPHIECPDCVSEGNKKIIYGKRGFPSHWLFKHGIAKGYSTEQAKARSAKIMSGKDILPTGNGVIENHPTSGFKAEKGTGGNATSSPASSALKQDKAFSRPESKDQEREPVPLPKVARTKRVNIPVFFRTQAVEGLSPSAPTGTINGVYCASFYYVDREGNLYNPRQITVAKDHKYYFAKTVKVE